MSEGISKKEQALGRFRAHNGLFSCPVCESTLVTVDSQASLCCENNHCFDLARKGYLNLFLGSQNSQYDKALFSARQKVFAAGIYDPLVSAVAEWIERRGVEAPCILDAGCGEGSLSAMLSAQLGSPVLVGLDIARDGITLATSHQAPVMWLVADLARLPLTSASLDVVLNVLSPANYAEFSRVLKPGGVVIKVLPGEDYLAEIRDRLPGVAAYSNDEVLGKFQDKMEIEDRLHLHYRAQMTEELWKAMVQMTPLSQNRKIQGEIPRSVTIDLHVLEGTVV